MTDNLKFNDMQARNNQVLDQIGQLQQEELRLYEQINQANMNPENRALMVDRVNQLSQHRTMLYGTLKDQYEFQNQSVSGNITTLGEQMYAINIVENELNQSKDRLNELINQKNDKLRLVQINTYFGKKYGAYKRIMQIIVYACIPLILLGILGNRGFIPSNLNALVMGIIIVIVLFMIGGQIVDLSRRDNMNFDEYDWAFDKNAAPNGDSATRTNPWDLSSMNLTCVGAQCCTEGMTYDTTIKKCVPKVEKPVAKINMDTTTESDGTFGNLLSKYGVGVPIPSSSPSVINGFTNYASV
jgi:hypothetical protein